MSRREEGGWMLKSIFTLGAKKTSFDAGLSIGQSGIFRNLNEKEFKRMKKENGKQQLLNNNFKEHKHFKKLLYEKFSKSFCFSENRISIVGG